MTNSNDKTHESPSSKSAIPDAALSPDNVFTVQGAQQAVNKILESDSPKPEMGEDYTVTFTPEQFQHFTEGDGLYFKDESGEVIAFAHYDNLEGSIELQQQRDRIQAANRLLALGESLLTQRQGYLELDDTAAQGLAGYLGIIRAQLTHFPT